MELAEILMKWELSFHPPRSRSEKPSTDAFSSRTAYLRAKFEWNTAQVLNPGLVECSYPNQNVETIRKWANGESSEGLIKPGYGLLSDSQSTELVETYAELTNEGVIPSYLTNFYPILSNLNGYDIGVFSDNITVWAINIQDRILLRLATSLASWFEVRMYCWAEGIYKQDRVHESDPLSYLKSELEFVRKIEYREDIVPLTKKNGVSIFPFEEGESAL